MTPAVRRRGCLALALAVVVAQLAGCSGSDNAQEAAFDTVAYVAEVEAWRAERADGLRADDSWLTLVGLFWLDAGSTPFGTDPDLPVVFPAGSAPARAGTFTYDGERVTVEPAADVTITIDGEPVTRRALQDDGDAAADVLRLGRLTFHVIERNGRHGIRVKDPESPVRTGFHGLDWFPVDPAWRIVARYEAHAEARPVDVPNVMGTTTRQFSPGDVVFERDGVGHRLVPLVSDPADTHFFFIVRDTTAGRETYGAGRYFYADLEGDRVVLDFNKAYNMPCVFTPFATCTLPPPENRLAFAIPAGEKMYGEHH